MSFQLPAVTLSARAPTPNPFLTKSKNPTIDTCNEHDTNTVDTSTFPWVSAATQSLLEREPTRSKDKGLLSYNIDDVMFYSDTLTNCYNRQVRLHTSLHNIFLGQGIDDDTSGRSHYRHDYFSY